MASLGISEILERVSSAKKVEEKIELLQKHNSPVLRDILRLAYDKDIVWMLPEGNPPYKKNDLTDQHGNLYASWRRMYLFFPGGNDNLTDVKREYLFIQILESIDPRDAELLLAIKDKKMPYKTVTKNLIEKAFPGFFGAQEA